MRIKTHHNGYFWVAIDDATHDMDEPEGHGRTEEEAIEDLLWQILERTLDIK